MNINKMDISFCRYPFFVGIRIMHEGGGFPPPVTGACEELLMLNAGPGIPKTQYLINKVRVSTVVNKSVKNGQ